MAGGKETPRQKMIGMMYLVLTALLALNVSKAILDAFVAIEENIQISNLNEYGRGEEKRLDLKEVAEDKSNPEAMKKAKVLMAVVDKIDKMTIDQVKLLDGLKMEILEKCGENVKEVGPEFIVTKAYSEKDPLKPIRMNLMKVDGKDKYDEPMDVMGIADDIKRPTGNGLKMWDSYMKFRGDLTSLIAESSSTKEGKFSFKDPNVRNFKDISEVSSILDKAMKNVAPDDKDMLKKIYMSLTKKELDDMHEGEIKDVHWIGRTFDHSPSVAAIASLSSLQKEILTARADAVALIRLRVGGGEYSFNKIMALAYGPEVVNQNEEVKLEVLMAAFDSDKQPAVTMSGTSISKDNIRDGKAYIVTKSGSTEMNLSGTITILNKSGVAKTLPWSKKIQVMKPQGTVSLPELNVLYKGYANKVEGVASGYDQTILTGSGVSLVKSGTGYIGTVNGAGKTASITVAGKNTTTNKTVTLGSFPFRVMTLPNPSLFFGATEEGGKASKVETRLFAKYSNSPLNATFTVLEYELNVAGAPRPAKGTGNVLSGEAMNLLKQAKPGSQISFMTKVVGPDKIQRKKGGVFTI
jgi:hypothetical protein